ncbi:hypothetical protein GCM10027280_62550 [Micromonospora polyrhachis]|uniref:Uncharacterized protein n=1 Tax=Micromonospora polyrhachis TaxID=1282883 RepID=A0A7W7SVW0_9ACTN|nr:hypothetical protein [Micromonospora polyrhachis]MBB4961930.1 hypothetical protein [Micromonospora polyrhachis]
MTGHLADERLRTFGQPARITVWPPGDSLLCMGDAEVRLRIVARDDAFVVEKQDRGGAWCWLLTSEWLDVARRYLLWEIGGWVEAAAGRRPGRTRADEPLRDGFTLTDLGPSGFLLSWTESAGERSARLLRGLGPSKTIRFARFADAAEETIVRRFGAAGASSELMRARAQQRSSRDPASTGNERAAVAELGRLLREELPPDADRITLRAIVLTSVGASTMTVRRADGMRELVQGREAVVTDAVATLRKAAYLTDLGTWFGLEMTVTSAGDLTTRFNHDDEPDWGPVSVDPIAYVMDQRRYPRSETAQPQWLRDHLAEGRVRLHQRLVDWGSELFHRIAPGVVLDQHPLPEDDAVVVVHPVRGGGSIYVAPDESVLFMASAVPPHQALEMFRSGRRTPVERFGASRPAAAGGG